MSLISAIYRLIEKIVTASLHRQSPAIGCHKCASLCLFGLPLLGQGNADYHPKALPAPGDRAFRPEELFVHSLGGRGFSPRKLCCFPPR
jgi:hypothetical protein